MYTAKNLFIDLHEAKYGTDERRFGRGWENLFTDQYAFFLGADLPSATAVARTLFPGLQVSVRSVATQAVSDVGTPDFCFELATGEPLYVEHKFDAHLDKTQLQRYIALGRVALVSRRNQSIPKDVLDSPNYSHPTHPQRDYYNWEDVYVALPPSQEAPEGFGGLRDHFRGYMRELELAPINITSEWRRLFQDRILPENQKVQNDFGRLLNGVKTELSRRGLHVEDCNHFAKQAWAPSGAAWHHLFVYPRRVPADYLEPDSCKPFDPGYEALLVDLVFDEHAKSFAASTYEALPSHVKDRLGNLWYRVKPRPVVRTRIRVALATPLVPFLAEERDLANRLTSAALTAIDTLLDATTSPLSPTPTNGGGTEGV